ncbi:LysM peptidoglycan-binding domain-containing protein [Desmospora profundinema]|uniref:LysM domain-containing protein n=1 Tax=Desmospora profundinema TaxID=1571184 RepID=A0ABU1IRK3_9BACL|nr:LysM domain-containing protein [Desmospora profundinema]MDR6226375.1 hypothetical protein [Desmospora profundinema]
MKLHIVQPGDTVWSIARRFDIPIQTLLHANDDLGDPDRLEPGTKVRIPTGKVPVSLHKTSEAAVQQEPTPSPSKESSSSRESSMERPSLGRDWRVPPPYPSPGVPPMPEAPKYQPQEPMPLMPPGTMPSPYPGLTPDMPPTTYPTPAQPPRKGCGCGPKQPAHPYPPSPMMPGPGYPAPGPMHPMPGPGYPAPGPMYPMPGMGYPAPGPMYPMPGVGYPAPGHRYPMPGVGYPAPGHRYPMPGVGYPAPGHRYPMPGVGDPAPGYPGTPGMTHPMTPSSEEATPPDAPLKAPSSLGPLHPLPLESSEQNNGQTRDYTELFRNEEERESSSAEL